MSEKKLPNYLLTTNSISVSYNSKHYMVSKAAEPTRYDAIKAALIARDLDAFVDALIPATRIIKYSNEYFEVDDSNRLFMKDQLSVEVPNYIAKRILEFEREKLPIEPLVLFWKKLRKNPSKDSQEMLYGFLEANHHTLTEDGNFIAYKKVDRVDDKLVDNYTRKMDNSIGKIVSMPREEVVEDKNQTCSRGLHVAAWDYAQSYSGNVLVEVMVDPTDVVSVPIDHNNQKMRVCRYKVVCEVGVTEPHKEIIKSDYDNRGMKHVTDVKCAVKGKKVSFVSLTAKELIDVTKSIMGKDAEILETMSLKNKQSIAKKAKAMLEGRGYTVIMGTPSKR